MAISLSRAAQCIGRRVFQGASASYGRVTKVDLEFQNLYVTFDGEDDPELVNPIGLEWVKVLSDEERFYFENIYLDGSAGDLVSEPVPDGRLYLNVQDGEWVYVQMMDSYSPTGDTLDAFGFCPDTARTVYIDDRTDITMMHEFEECAGWANL